MKRLCNATMADSPAGVARPAYDRMKVKTGIVHLGVGAFHRAHQAVYTDDVLNSGALNWGILAVSLRSPDTRDALKPQDGLFTVAARGAEGDRLRIVGAISNILVAPENPQAVLAAMASPHVKIVSLTITEKGYCRDPATGLLDESHPDILHDLAHPLMPRSAIGYIVSALKMRRDKGIAPFTVLCCDNLPANGKTVAGVIQRFASLLDTGLGAFIAAEVACPATMVDRIVPATTDDDRAMVASALGLKDAWPVVTEPFSQWVIEDHFPLGRPQWEAHGAQLVKDVAPYETMKLRLLNGSHSSLAFLGGVAGHTTVAQAMNDEIIAAFIIAYMREDVTPTLTLPPGADVAAYQRALCERFKNPALKHQLVQIASDSTQKIPQRFISTLQDRLDKGLPIGRIAVSLAAFIRFAQGRDEQGHALVLRDPLAQDLAQCIARAGDDSEALAKAVLGLSAVFGPLGADKAVVASVAQWHRHMAQSGIHATLRRLAATGAP